jgi:hypothetical protein
MQKRIWVVAAAFAVLLLFVLTDSYRFSPTGRFVDVEDAVHHLDVAQKDYNANIQNVPNFVKTLFGNERINGTITMLDGSTAHVSAETKDGAIVNLTTDNWDSYTIDVQTTEKTVNDIAQAPDQVARLRQALDQKEINYQSRSIMTSIKTGLASIFLTIWNWFG